MDKIIIEVRGGVVVAVYSTNPKISVKVLDHDCIDSQNLTIQERQMLKDIHTMQDILC